MDGEYHYKDGKKLKAPACAKTTTFRADPDKIFNHTP